MEKVYERLLQANIIQPLHLLRMKEIWKDVPGFEGYCQVSNLARIRSVNRKAINGRTVIGKVLKLRLHGEYIGLSFRKDYKETAIHVHRAMALAFIPNPENKPQVNHKNGIKTDNRLDNFEWATPKENTVHALQNGLLRVSDRHPQCKIKEKQIPKIKSLFKSGKTKTAIAKIYGVHAQTICDIISGHRMVVGL